MTTAATQDPATGQATRRVTVYHALAEDIKKLGVDAVFGLMSDDTADFAVTLDMIGIGFHGARHENSAIAMAEGYAAALVAVLAVQGIGLIWLIMMPLLWRRAEPL